MSTQSHLPTPNAHKGSFITFACGNSHYALNVNCVKYITSIDAITLQNTPLQDGTMNRIFSFSDRPVVLYSFNKIVGSYSQVEQSKALITFLTQCKQEHIDWIDALEQSIKTDTAFNQAADPLLCNFGKWYVNYQSDDEELTTIMKKFERPHNYIHCLAEKLITLSQDKTKLSEALTILEKEKHTTLNQLLNLFGAAQARLEEMVKQVIIVIESQGKVFAIDLDNIEQMEEFHERDWLADNAHDNDQHPCYEGFFQKTQGNLYIHVDPNMLIN
ncbi:CZB domain-containing protein [Marinicellulosiphila megalodicopiae]|uniref:CZB domain-containing protein n=1 Tax=Marinicellulosiphila megalodicopiae TaxID=2724896 RepID=UPI003BB0503C